MKQFLLICLLFQAFGLWANDTTSVKCVMVIHGGAGNIVKGNITPEKEREYTMKLTEALQKGYDEIKAGKSALDAVTETIKILEDSPLFNAGRGSVYTNKGTVENDASIMEGKTLNAGAVAGTRILKNPIMAARAVLESSEHVMMAGRGAEEFAKKMNLEIVDTSYFILEERNEEFKKMKEKVERRNDRGELNEEDSFIFSNEKFGTVGAVALDREGNLAAGTSTGGMWNKKYGRIGDSPIIGAGTYANNATCGVSSTGHGEFFIRAMVAYDISALMEYQNMSIKEASHKVIQEKLHKLGGSGGVICLDKEGNASLEFNTSGMFRGMVDANGKITVKLYKD